jgi:hypothetical protein
VQCCLGHSRPTARTLSRRARVKRRSGSGIGGQASSLPCLRDTLIPCFPWHCSTETTSSPATPRGCELAWKLALKGNVLFHELSRTHMFAHTIADLCGGKLMQRRTTWITDLPHNLTETLVCNHETGWISQQSSDGSCPLRLCWLPVDRRGESFACYGNTIANQYRSTAGYRDNHGSLG